MKPIKADKIRVILSWDQSPSPDVDHYRLYISTEGPCGYDSPYCEVPRPRSHKKAVIFNLAECPFLDGHHGMVSVRAGAVDTAGNVSDLSSPVEVLVDFDNMWARLYRAINEDFVRGRKKSSR